ncbi:MAG: AMP-binding protein [Candidatus Omnitrophica bacterium]|nr:AMP-binding protein [Candidatus Omnitrophota bacterium]
MTLYEKYNSLGALLRGTAREHRNKPAVIFQNETISYSELEYFSDQIAHELTNNSIGKNDCIGLYCVNSPFFIAAYFGIIKTGATVVPINLLLSSEEIQYILYDSEAAGLIYLDSLEDNIIPAINSLPDLHLLIVIGRSKKLNAVSFNDILAFKKPAFKIPELLQHQDVAVILYTSGTTGKPKGVMLTHRNLLFDVDAILQAVPINEKDVVLAVLPMFHAFGATACMITPIATGAAIAAVSHFTLDNISHVVTSTKTTIFIAVPSIYTIYSEIPDGSKPDFPFLRFCISGGSALSMEVMQRFEKKYNVLIYEGDGPTECSPVTSINPIGGIRKPRSIGLPLPGIKMKIMDNFGKEMQQKEIGEIVVQGENIMKGYFKCPKETQESFWGTWFRTGDLGYSDEDGYFYIIDRKKDIIIVNGMNVYPRIIEEVIYKHPAVAEVAVISYPDSLHGEVPKALIVLKPCKKVLREEILSLCHQHLGKHEIPKIIEFIQEMPKTSTGKIQKRVLAFKEKSTDK